MMRVSLLLPPQASWGVFTKDEGETKDEPDEENVPFIMKLNNEGLRIVSKMRRINYVCIFVKAPCINRALYLPVGTHMYTSHKLCTSKACLLL